MAYCTGMCHQGREVCKTPERCGLITSDGGESVDFTAEATLGKFGWACIAAVIFLTACIAFAGYSLWPSVAAAFN